MFTLGIPNSQQRRANNVLTHDRSTAVEYEVYKQDKDFHIFTFDVDYDGFHDIVLLLKSNGISPIGADEQLTERKIMKLTKLLEQKSVPVAGMEDTTSQGFGSDNQIKTIDQVVQVLTNILKTWETKEYNSPTERYEEYYMDIEDLVKELTNQSPSRDSGTMTDDEANDMPDVSDINESKLQLKDFFTEQEDLEKMRDDLTMRDMERKQAEFDRAQKSAKNAGVKTYGDLSDEEWEAEREKMGMKTDAEGNKYIDFKYDPGNEPLEIQMNPDQGEYANKIFYIEPEDIEAYVNGEDVEAIRPDAGFGEPDEVTANKNNSDVTGVSEDELKDFMVSGDRSADDLNEDKVESPIRAPGRDCPEGQTWFQVGTDFGDGFCHEGTMLDGGDVYGKPTTGGKRKSRTRSMNERDKEKKKKSRTKEELRALYFYCCSNMLPCCPSVELAEGCTEEQIKEGTCGHGLNGKTGDKPAGPSLIDFFK